MSSTPINFKVVGAGAWGFNFRTWSELLQAMSGNPVVTDAATAPKPAIIPANERRRAPLSVKLAVESSWQATQMAGIDPAELGCVFASGLGDTSLTDYMCKALASDSKALSPTKFHNSVHNAAAGYWTISTGCMSAANSIAAFQESVSVTLLEALIQAQAENRPLLLTFYDAPVAPLLQSMLKNQAAFAMSLVIAPDTYSHPSGEDVSLAHSLSAQLVETPVDWPTLSLPDELHECYSSNPAARVIALAQLLQTGQGELLLPLSMATALQITQNADARSVT
jgi:hypothetical protein